LGVRRSEALALRWSDIQEGIDAATGDPIWRVSIARSLTQTKKVLQFKSTKNDHPHVVALSYPQK